MKIGRLKSDLKIANHHHHLQLQSNQNTINEEKNKWKLRRPAAYSFEPISSFPISILAADFSLPLYSPINEASFGKGALRLFIFSTILPSHYIERYRD